MKLIKSRKISLGEEVSITISIKEFINLYVGLFNLDEDSREEILSSCFFFDEKDIGEWYQLDITNDMVNIMDDIGILHSELVC